MKEQQANRSKALIDDWIVPVLVDEFLRERELGPYQTNQVISRKLPLTPTLDPESDRDSEPPRIASPEQGQ